MPFIFLSCTEELEPVIVPSIEVKQTVFDVGYKSGEIPLDVESNVIFYATVDAASKKWLSYEFSDSCKNLKLVYQ